RERVILRCHRGFAARESGFALRYGSLTPLHFALRHVVRSRLRKRRRATERQPDQIETEDNKDCRHRTDETELRYLRFLLFKVSKGVCREGAAKSTRGACAPRSKNGFC